MSPLAHNQEFLERGGGGGLVAKLCPTLATPWTVACHAPLSMAFSRREYWSGLPFPSPGGSSRPRDRTRVSGTAGRVFTNWATREVKVQGICLIPSPDLHRCAYST